MAEARPITLTFADKGLNLKSTSDEISVQEFAVITNCTSNREGAIRSRFGSSLLNSAGALSNTDVHTLTRLKGLSASYRYAVAGTSIFRSATPFTTYSAIYPGATWLASRTYKVGDLVVPTASNGHFFRCTTAGTSGAAEPTWTTTTAGTTADNTVVWTESNFTGNAMLTAEYAVGLDTKPYTFFCDTKAFVKDYGTGAPSLVGIVPPANVAAPTTAAYTSTSIETFEDYTTWTEVDASAILTLANEATIKKVGTNSLKCTFSAAGNAYIYKNATLDLSTLPDTAVIHIYIYSTNLIGLDEILMQLSIGDTTFNERYEKAVGPSALVPGINFAASTHIDTVPSAAEDNVFNQATDETFPDFPQYTPEPLELGNNIWTELKIMKSDILKIAATDSGNDWSDVKAIRLNFRVNAATVLYFDDWTMLGGGQLSGIDYTWKYVYRNSATGIQSNPSTVSASPATAPVQNPVNVVCTFSRDPQVDYIDVYRAGGTLEDYQFTGSVANTPGAAGSTTTYSDTIADALLGDTLNTDNDRPYNFSGIVLHNETLFGFGSTNDPPNAVRFSKRVNVEQWPSTYILYVGSDKVTTLVTMGEQLYAITLGQIYRIIGTNADSYQALSTGYNRGSIDQIFCTTEMPGSAAVVCYDGIYEFPSGKKLTQPIDGVFHGLTVNGIAPINTTYLSKIRMEFYDNRLHVAYTTGSATDNNAEMIFDVLYERWEMSDRTIRSILAEKETNTLLMGNTSGNIYQIETGTTDAGTAIAMDMQTGYLHLGTPGQDKIFSDGAIDLDTGGADVSLQLFFNNGDTSDTAVTINTASRTLTPFSIASGAGVMALNAQLRLSASLSVACTIYKCLLYVLLEPPSRGAFQTAWTDNGYPYDKYIKELLLEIDTAGLAATVHLDVDGTDDIETFSVTTTTRQRVTLSVARDTIGKLMRIRVTGNPAKLYSEPGYIVQNDFADVTIADSLDQSFSVPRWKLLRRFWISLKAQADVSMAVYADGILKTTETITATDSSFNWEKVLVNLPDKIKGKMIRTVFTSASSFKINWPASLCEFRDISRQNSYQSKVFTPPELM